MEILACLLSLTKTWVAVSPLAESSITVITDTFCTHNDAEIEQKMNIIVPIIISSHLPQCRPQTPFTNISPNKFLSNPTKEYIKVDKAKSLLYPKLGFCCPPCHIYSLNPLTFEIKQDCNFHWTTNLLTLLTSARLTKECKN